MNINFFTNIKYRIYDWYYESNWEMLEDFDNPFIDFSIQITKLVDTKKYKINFVPKHIHRIYRCIPNSICSTPICQEIESELINNDVAFEQKIISLKRVGASASLSQELVKSMSKQTMKKYLTHYFYNEFSNLLNNTSWSNLYINNIYVPIYYSKTKIWQISKPLQLLNWITKFFNKPKKYSFISIKYTIFISFYIGGE